MSDYHKIILAILIGAYFCVVIIIGTRWEQSHPEPPCTAYQAIDGKPVCIEYHLKEK